MKSEPVPLTCPGMPLSRNTARSASRACSPSALSRSKASGVMSAMAARPATMVSGLALKVPPCGTRTPCPSISSKTSMTSARPATAPTGSPPPMILPRAVRSGWTPRTPWLPP